MWAMMQKFLITACSARALASGAGRVFGPG
jgi:hypothetical protein